MLKGLRRAAMVVFACYCTYDALSEARATTVRHDRASEYDELVAPLKADLVELGIAPDAVIGYQDALLGRPVGSDVYSGFYLHLTRLFLAPLRLVPSTEPEWLLVVRLEGAVPDLDRSGFTRVKRYPGMDLYRRAGSAPLQTTSEEQ